VSTQLEHVIAPNPTNINHSLGYSVMENLYRLSDNPRKASIPARFPYLQLSELRGQQLALGESIVANTRSGLTGIWNVFLHSAGVTNAFLKLYDYLRCGTAIPARLIEITALLVAVEERSDYVWAAHAPLAINAGVPEAVILDIKNGQRPTAMQQDESILYDFLVRLLRQHEVTAETFAAANRYFSTQSLVDFVALVGQYKTVSMLVTLGDLPPPGN
jgi:4-carboxymuconolactone decarboxylase